LIRAAVVDGRVVDYLVGAGLGIDLDHGDVHLRRVGQGEVAELPLDVGHLERGPVDVAAVERDVEVIRQAGVVRVDDRAASHEREERVTALLDPDAAVGELEALRRHAAEDGSRELLDLGASISVAPLTAPSPVTANWLAYVPEKPACEFQ